VTATTHVPFETDHHADEMVVKIATRVAVEIVLNGGTYDPERIAPHLRQQLKENVERELAQRAGTTRHSSFTRAGAQLMPASGLGNGGQNPSGSGNF
jgi:hypothetical protein